MTNDQIDDVLESLHQLALSEDVHEYGLPLANEHLLELMRETIRDFAEEQIAKAIDAIARQDGK